MNDLSSSDISLFQSNILKWYKINGRHKLPWRRANLSSYKIIIAEILLQRTKADKVQQLFPDFLGIYPNWKSIVTRGIRPLEAALTPLGLQKQRASRLMALAKKMLETKGKLPKKSDELDKLPLFGQYLIYATQLQIYKQNKPLLDVNMARVLERYFGKRQLADIRYDPYLQELAHRIASHQQSKLISWAILDFASACCKAKVPICATCSFSGRCKFSNNVNT